MVSKKHFSRIGEVVLLLILVLLLTTSVSAKRHLFADPNEDVGVKGAKIDKQDAQDNPWGRGGWGGGYYPPSKIKSKTKVKT